MYTRLETLDHRILVDLLALRLVAQPSPPSVISGTAVLTQLPGQSVTARLKEMKKKKKKEKEREREREKRKDGEKREPLSSPRAFSPCAYPVFTTFFFLFTFPSSNGTSFFHDLGNFLQRVKQIVKILRNILRF